MERMAKIDMLLEMELGITGGEEDGVNNEDCNPEDLYTKPEEAWEVHQILSKVDSKFTVAAAFGNVHGVYAPVRSAQTSFYRPVHLERRA